MTIGNVHNIYFLNIYISDLNLCVNICMYSKKIGRKYVTILTVIVSGQWDCG